MYQKMMSLNFCLMQSCWLVQICTQITFFLQNSCMNFWNSRTNFSFVFANSYANSCTNSYLNSQVNFVHEIRRKFVIFDKLGKFHTNSREFVKVISGALWQGSSTENWAKSLKLSRMTAGYFIDTKFGMVTHTVNSNLKPLLFFNYCK